MSAIVRWVQLRVVWLDFISNHIKSFNEHIRSSIFSLLRRLQDSENPLFVIFVIPLYILEVLCLNTGPHNCFASPIYNSITSMTCNCFTSLIYNSLTSTTCNCFTSKEDPSWCQCDICRHMSRPEKRLCCQRRAGECIQQTAAKGLDDVVFWRNVLLVAVRHTNDLFAYNEQSCGQFVLWRFDRLGCGNMVVIPSSVVWPIRDLYQSADRVYTGFKVARFT